MISRILSEMSGRSGFLYGLYCRLRLLTCPFGRIAEQVPAAGRILDLGCGAGLFSFLLSSGFPARSIVSVDCRPERIRSAARAAEKYGFTAISFNQGDITSADYPKDTDCILLIDVLYQLSLKEKTGVIGKCYDSLKDKGILLVKENAAGPGWKRLFCYLQETVFARLAGLNLKRVEPLPAGDWMRLFAGKGFSVQMRRIDRGYPYPHILFVCRKPGLK